jgi:arylsulfatase A-like enzyme
MTPLLNAIPFRMQNEQGYLNIKHRDQPVMINYILIPRNFITIAVGIAFSMLFSVGCSASEKNQVGASTRPNVILIMSDDQGIGDFGINGNPIVQTPFIDKMARNSASMSRFYVNAVCSPTRSSLMTGRWSYRTGVTDTFKGRSIMNSEETTIAEVLKDAGFSTGLFGKWHLGDNYPYRPMDQGFETAIYHRGGGLGQPSEPMGADERYTNPVLFRNGVQYTAEGFCCDIYFSEAINFIKGSRDKNKPFFAYIASNTPHSPYHDVPEKWLQYYKGLNLENSQFPQDQGHKISGSDDMDDRARIYAMVSNLDENVGRLFRELDQLSLLENTVVIYMCDNGPNSSRYVSGFKGRKSNAWEGGVRSPFWAHWPKEFKGGTVSDSLSAHVDVFPTILDLCNVDLPDDLSIDGQSILGYLNGQKRKPDDRTVILQSHRGEEPESWENATLVTQQWKLVTNGKSEDRQLFNLSKDPFALKNVIGDFPEVRGELENKYGEWLTEMRKINPMDLPLFVGTDHERETVLTSQDAKEIDAESNQSEWRLKVVESGIYQIGVSDKTFNGPITVDLLIDNEQVATLTTNGSKERYYFDPINIKEGRRTLRVIPHVRDNRFLHVFISKKDR